MRLPEDLQEDGRSGQVVLEAVVADSVALPAVVADVDPRYRSYLALARFPELDGLRALSILPVIWHHSTTRLLDGVLGKGPLGVHLFFAISGFLITTLLLRERRATGAISMKNFYARRSLRIFPLYYAVLGIY